MREGFAGRLEACIDYADIFELVKEGVEKTLDKSRAGLMLGLANLGGSRGFYIGAYYPLDSNIIVLNTYPIHWILERHQALFKPYVFHVLLHEYLHSLGYLDEGTVRKMTFGICEKIFRRGHMATEMSYDIQPFLPGLTHPTLGWFPQKEPEIRIVQGFDKGNLTYVS